SERPFVRWPFIGRNELRCVAKIDNPLRQPFQIRFRAAARRIAAAHEGDCEFAVRHQILPILSFRAKSRNLLLFPGDSEPSGKVTRSITETMRDVSHSTRYARSGQAFIMAAYAAINWMQRHVARSTCQKDSQVKMSAHRA